MRALLPMRLSCWFLLVFFLPALTVTAARPFFGNFSDSSIFLEKRALLAQKTGVSTALQTLALAQSFLGAPYVTGTLDRGLTEQVVVNLHQLDCWTLVENCLALAHTGPTGSFETFKSYLQKMRYWGGTINGYGSRIHYFTGWLLQAEKAGYVEDITRTLGGIPYQKAVHYISSRPEKYPKIKKPEILREIKAAEARIHRHSWYFIPKSRIAAKEHLLQEGDLIIITSSKHDLDVSHQGFAVRRNGRIHLLHASSLARKTIVSAQPLPQYLAKQRGMSGIMVARMKPSHSE